MNFNNIPFELIAIPILLLILFSLFKSIKKDKASGHTITSSKKLKKQRQTLQQWFDVKDVKNGFIIDQQNKKYIVIEVGSINSDLFSDEQKVVFEKSLTRLLSTFDFDYKFLILQRPANIDEFKKYISNFIERYKEEDARLRSEIKGVEKEYNNASANMKQAEQELEYAKLQKRPENEITELMNIYIEKRNEFEIVSSELNELKLEQIRIVSKANSLHSEFKHVSDLLLSGELVEKVFYLVFTADEKNQKKSYEKALIIEQNLKGLGLDNSKICGDKELRELLILYINPYDKVPEYTSGMPIYKGI